MADQREFWTTRGSRVRVTDGQMKILASVNKDNPELESQHELSELGSVSVMLHGDNEWFVRVVFSGGSHGINAGRYLDVETATALAGAILTEARSVGAIPFGE